MSAFHTMTLFMPKHFKPRHIVPTLSSPYLHPFAAAAAACDDACRCHLPELLRSVYLLLTAVFTIDNLPNSISPSERTREGGFIPSVTVVLHFSLPFALCFKGWLTKSGSLCLVQRIMEGQSILSILLSSQINQVSVSVE